MKNIHEVNKISKEDVPTITFSLNKSYDYLKITHNIQKNFGFINIMSSFGDYAYIWGAMGEENALPEFFVGADKHYLSNKLFGPEQNEFDLDKAVKDMKTELFKDRRERNMDHDVAREVYDFIVDEVDCSDGMSLDLFSKLLWDSDAISKWNEEWYDGCSWGMRLKCRFLTLRDEIIPLIQQYFKGELKEGRL